MTGISTIHMYLSSDNQPSKQNRHPIRPLSLYYLPTVCQSTAPRRPPRRPSCRPLQEMALQRSPTALHGRAVHVRLHIEIIQVGIGHENALRSRWQLYQDPLFENTPHQSFPPISYSHLSCMFFFVFFCPFYINFICTYTYLIILINPYTMY